MAPFCLHLQIVASYPQFGGARNTAVGTGTGRIAAFTSRQALDMAPAWDWKATPAALDIPSLLLPFETRLKAKDFFRWQIPNPTRVTA
jgi:hypothetical protein